MKILLSTLTACLFLILGSCTPKLYSIDKDLQIKEAFTQKEVPGQEGAKTQEYLKVNFSLANGTTVFIDSVSFRGVTTTINSASNSLKIRLNATQIKNKTKSSMEEAILYFTKDQKPFKRTINNVGSKDPIYLP